MPKYVLSYHGGGMAPTEEEQAKVAAAWGQWFQALGDKVVDGGLYVMRSVTVDRSGSVTEGGGSNPVTGYSVIQASDMDAATAVAKGCPVLLSGASVEVGEAMEMG